MKCKICGRDNAADATRCANCGAALYNSRYYNQNPNKKQQSDNILAAAMIILVIALICVAAAFVHNTRKPRHASFRGGGGGGYVSSVTAVPSAMPAVMPTVDAPDSGREPGIYERGSGNAPAEVPMEAPTEAPPVNNSLSVKEEFLNEARNIEQYEESHLEYASTQNEMNRESLVVYEKWDALLNEIYQYLKNTLPANEFAVLQSDEQAWIREKEAAADEALREWQGGSAAPAMVNGTKAEYTKNRCDYLISQIR